MKAHPQLEILCTIGGICFQNDEGFKCACTGMAHQHFCLAHVRHGKRTGYKFIVLKQTSHGNKFFQYKLTQHCSSCTCTTYLYPAGGALPVYAGGQATSKTKQKFLRITKLLQGSNAITVHLQDASLTGSFHGSSLGLASDSKRL